MHPAIRVDDLGKCYRIAQGGRPGGYRTLRESVMGAPAALWGRVRNRLGGGGGDLFWALKGVHLEVRPGEIVGIIGHNGAGKSTLLKILSRITKPTEGWAELRGRVSSLLEVGTGFHPELTGRENIYLNGSILGMSRGEIARRFDEIVAFAEVERFLETPVKRYSSGMYVRLAFAVAAHLESEILFLDEVLAVGDAQFQKKCLGKMEDIATGGRTILLVSHQMNAIQHLSHRAALLERGRLVAYGPKDEVIARYLSSGRQAGSPGEWIDLSQAGRIGVGGARFVAARYRCPDEVAAGHPYPDSPLEVTVAIEADAVKGVDGLSVTFRDRYGTLLVSPNILTLGRSVEFRRGRNEVTFLIDQLHLNPGVYTIGFTMYSHTIGDKIDYVNPAFQMEVVDASTPDRPVLGPAGHGQVTCRFEVLT